MSKTNLSLVTNTPEDGSGTLTSTATFSALSGMTYQIVVSGSFFTTPGVPVTFSFSPDAMTEAAVYGSGDRSVLRPRVVLRPMPRTDGSSLRLEIDGGDGAECAVFLTSDLSTPLSQWSLLLKTNLPTGSCFVWDRSATNSTRFYRVGFAR